MYPTTHRLSISGRDSGNSSKHTVHPSSSNRQDREGVDYQEEETDTNAADGEPRPEDYEAIGDQFLF